MVASSFQFGFSDPFETIVCLLTMCPIMSTPGLEAGSWRQMRRVRIRWRVRVRVRVSAGKVIDRKAIG